METVNGDDLKPISELHVPLVPDTAPIQHDWRKAAHRLVMNMIQKIDKRRVFNQPVDFANLGCWDYP